MIPPRPKRINNANARDTEMRAGVKKTAEIKGIDTEKLHTTPLGERRVRRNIGLGAETDVVAWARRAVDSASDQDISRRGKNFYVYSGHFILTINAHSNTLITAHKIT